VAARSRRAIYPRDGFASRLVELRARRDLTQQALADRTGVTVRVVQRWESGRVFPNEDSLPRLAAALDVSREELLGIPGDASATSVRERLDRIERRQIDLADRFETLQADFEALRHDLAPLVVLAKRRTFAARDGR
jgi:transcriptional regulator with XRE-family HTH domain